MTSYFNPGPEQVQEILHRYQSEAASVIAHDFGVGRRQIYHLIARHIPQDERLALAHRKRALTKLGVNNPMYVPFAPERIPALVVAYKTGLSSRFVASRFGISDYLVRRILRENGITLRTRSEANALAPKRQAKYTVNHDFFQQPSLEMFYVLGLWFADGYVSRNRNSKIVGLGLKDADEQLLHRILGLMESSHPLHRDKSMLNFTFYSEHLYDDLVHWGCTPNKSLTLRFPEIPQPFQRDFIRGFFDGDGSVTRAKRQPIQIGAYFSMGSAPFLEELARLVFQHIGINAKVHTYPNRNVVLLHYYGNNAETLLDWLYENVTLFLPRKHTRYLELKQLKECP